MNQNTRCSRYSLLLVALLFLAVSVASGRAASVAQQAEAGSLGSQITIGTNGITRYIMPTVNNATGNPGSATRVASYSVTFPAAGTYDLYARLQVGSGGANDDSFFYGNGFGAKSATTDADWILVNSINVGGFTNASDVVTNSGSAGVSVWKWINLSDYTGTAGETPITFTVTAGNLTQTFQIGTREDGLFIDALVFGSASNFTVAALDAAANPPPVSPTSLSASGGNAVVNLTWLQSISPGITQNKVYRSTAGSGGPYNPLVTLAPTTSYPDTAVVNGSTYFYTVTALSTNGESAFSGYSGATPNLPPPAAPTGLSATAGNAQVSLSWTASSGATSYNVKRATTSGGPYTTITNVTATSFINTGLANGTTYYFVVSALNAGGESANSSQASATPTAPQPPAAPTGLSATAGDAQVSLGWTASSGATSYNIKRATTSGGPYTTITNVTATSFVNTGLANGTTYFFVVSALNANGESANSSQVSATPTASSTPPLVYNVEHTGSGFPAPPLPTFANLPVIQFLPDPFAWANDPFGSTRSTAFSDWSHHRAEIKAQIENYEIGPKPAVSLANIFASVSGTGTSRTLTVRVTNLVNGVNRTLTLTSAIGLPGSSGTFPAIIGMNSPNGSISLNGRAIATINYQHNQVTTYGAQSSSDPYYQLYAAPYSPTIDTTSSGQYSGWAWGVSRLIDGLYKLNGNLGNGVTLNLQRIGVTGCSYAGKMALFAGAFDERIVLTIPQESGGGGAPNWRYSSTEPSGTVEWIPNTDYNWFANQLQQFNTAANVQKLPEDHHMLLAMVVPRALFANANPSGAVWLSNPSAWVSFKAVKRVYDQFGIPDRFGYILNNGGQGHCVTSSALTTSLTPFLDKFLMGLTNTVTAGTEVGTNASPYTTVNPSIWTAWWGTTGSTGTYTNTYEPECATVGSAWNIVSDAAASNGKYVTVNPSLESLASAPVGTTNLVTIPFSVATAGDTSIFARVNCPTADDDSFWVQVDGGTFANLNGLVTSGWEWVSFGSFNLSAGSHTLTIGYRENGAQLDKLSVSDNTVAPTGTGKTAAVLCP